MKVTHMEKRPYPQRSGTSKIELASRKLWIFFTDHDPTLKVSCARQEIELSLGNASNLHSFGPMTLLFFPTAVLNTKCATQNQIHVWGSNFFRKLIKIEMTKSSLVPWKKIDSQI